MPTQKTSKRSSRSNATPRRASQRSHDQGANEQPGNAGRRTSRREREEM